MVSVGCGIGKGDSKGDGKGGGKVEGVEEEVWLGEGDGCLDAGVWLPEALRDMADQAMEESEAVSWLVSEGAGEELYAWRLASPVPSDIVAVPGKGW